MIAWRAALAAGLALLSLDLRAEQPKNIIDEIRALPSPSVRIEQANAAARGQFDAAVAEYEARIAQYPYDVLERVQQCRFIDEFVVSYEYAAFVDELSEKAEECRETLAEQYASHPEVALMQLEQTYGEERLTAGAELLRKSIPGTWTAGQSARLYAMLVQTADLSENREQLALAYALKALELDEASDVRLSAATHLIARGEKQRAHEILTARPGDGAPENGFELARKMDLLSQLEAHQEVIALYSQLRTLKDYNHTQVARLLRAAGATDLARLELTRAGEGSQYTTEDERERFRLELESGSAEQALAAYQAWRDLGWTEDMLGINRFAVFVRDPLLPWRARDLLGPLGFIATLGAIALLCAVPIAGVHYRGLAARARLGEAYPTQGSRLLHAWLALFCFAAASVLALYSAGSVDLAAQEGDLGVDATPLQLGRIALVEMLFGLALLLPVAAVVNARQSPWWGTQWSIAKSCAVGAGLALALRIPLLLVSAARPETLRGAAPDDALWQVIGAVRDHYGIVAALWILVVAAPVVEELVFRGALYRAFAVHLRPGWANVLQAALFSAMHLNLRAAALLFVLGWVLGTLARRSGGLLAPMVTHAVFNLVAGLMFLRTS